MYSVTPSSFVNSDTQTLPSSAPPGASVLCSPPLSPQPGKSVNISAAAISSAAKRLPPFIFSPP